MTWKEDNRENVDRLEALEARVKFLEQERLGVEPEPRIGGMRPQPPALAAPRVLSDDSVEFFARVTGAATDGDNRWAYTFVEVEKTTAGYGGWTTRTGGKSGTMRNVVEDANAAAGTLGNGVPVASLDADLYTFTLQACPTNVVVPAWEVDLGATVEYWFAYENGIDGECT